MKTTKRSFAAILFFAAILLCWEETRTQTPGLSGGSVVIKHLSVDQGLSDRLVRWISQDSRGFIWVGTHIGLNRYDGERFTAFNSWGGNDSMIISHGDVWGGICGDSDGIVWIGTTRGLNKFNPETRSFKKYFHDARDPKSLSSDSINCVFIDRMGTLWVGTGWGLNKLNRETNTWSRYFPNPDDTSRPGENYISSILEDRHGTLWIGAGGNDERLAGGGLFKLDSSNDRFVSVGERVKVHTIYEDRSGELWAAVAGARFCKVDPSTGEFITVLLPPKDPGNTAFQGVRSICEDRSGFLWMATSGWGLLRYDKRSGTFTRFSNDPQNPETISSSALMTIFADKDGLIWVGTDRGGVNTVSPKPFKHIHTLGKSIQLTGRVDVVFQDREGYLWVAHQKGVWRYNPGDGKSTCILPKGAVMSILQDNDGIVWIADRFSVVKYDPKTSRHKTLWETPIVKGSRSRLIKIMFDSEKNLWVGCNTALYRVDRQFKTSASFVHNPRDSQSITFGLITALAEDRSGGIWVGTQKGVSRYDKKKGIFTRMLHDDKDSTTISNTDYINSFVDRNNQLWFGTNDGLNLYDDSARSFRRFYPADRRYGTNVNPLQEGTRGDLWFARPSEICKFDISTHAVTRFDRADGIEDVEILPYSRTRLKSGELLYGTSDGILVFHPDSVSKSQFLPPIVITGIKKLTRQVRITSEPELLREISFDHEENVFSISFSALSYDMPDYNQYAYKLEGFDKGWINCGNRREVMYTNLDPGTYTFHVKGSNHDQVWNEAGTSLRIIVNPAYWQTWWFRGLAVVIILGFVGFMYRREVNRLKKEKRLQQEFSQKQIEQEESERKRLASELHDGLGQDLLIVNNELQQFLNSGDGSRDDLRRVSTLVQESIEGVREISSSLHPHHIERLGFCAAVEAMIEKVSHSSAIPIQCVCEQIDTFLPKGSEIHLYRIIQESLSNIVKHAGATSALVEIRRKSGSVEVKVGDNGRGFDLAEFTTATSLHRGPTEISRGFGIASLSERARIIGAKLKIDSLPDRGTTVILTITIPENQ